jgi:hypothetical protein
MLILLARQELKLIQKYKENKAERERERVKTNRNTHTHTQHTVSLLGVSFKAQA